jgi:hypothetical protein
VAALLVGTIRPKEGDLPAGLHHVFFIEVPSLGFQPGGFFNEAELTLKICLNALTTGAFIQIGKVFHNQMIDLRISNHKLYVRAIETIARLARVDEGTAREALHRAAFRSDALEDEERDAPPSAVVKAAGSRARVVPTALLLARGGWTVAEAGELLQRDPVVRRVLGKMLEGEAR